MRALHRPSAESGWRSYANLGSGLLWGCLPNGTRGLTRPLVGMTLITEALGPAISLNGGDLHDSEKRRGATGDLDFLHEMRGRG